MTSAGHFIIVSWIFLIGSQRKEPSMSAAYLLVNERASGLPSFPDLWSSWSAASCGTSACESTVVCQAGACGAQIKWSGNQTSHLFSSSDKQITSAFINRKREATTAACCPALLHLAPDFFSQNLFSCLVMFWNPQAEFQLTYPSGLQYYIWMTTIVQRPLW